MASRRFTHLAVIALGSAILSLLGGFGAGRGAAPARAQASAAPPAHIILLKSASENADLTQATLPVYRGTSHGKTVWYVITDSDSLDGAMARGVNYAPKLAFARGTLAVQQVQIGADGLLDFPATVDFSQTRTLTPGPDGFPPSAAAAGPIGEPGYSPLIEMPSGEILNASQIANDSGQAPKVVTLDKVAGRVTYLETPGFTQGHEARYISLDATAPTAAALENVTLATALNAAPAPDQEGVPSAREGLIAFVNGQTGTTNPERQGLNSALLDMAPPLNVFHVLPSNAEPFSRYSPLWDVHLAAWTAAAVDAGQNLRQHDFDAVLQLVQQGLVTGPGGAPFAASGFIVNCPVVSELP